ncbi:MAG: DUF2384 domain-containing protein [Gemmataceae bacterium]|nr:DUF2384 domain-containing protein [Gemmataceae bacterium]
MTTRVQHKPNGSSKKTVKSAQPSRNVGATNKATKDLRHRLNLNQPDFARLLPISIRSLASLEAGKPPTPAVARRLNELQRLAKALVEVMKPDAMGSWLHKPNGALDGLKPLEVIDRGETDRLWEMIYFLRSGTPS